MNPDTKHPDYSTTETERDMFRDLIGGTTKLRSNFGSYLPRFPLESDKEYALRTSTATLLNVTKKTRDTMVGLVFQKEIVLGDDVDKTIADLAENIDNKGNHFNVFSRETFTDSFDGVAVIVTDSPETKAKDLGEQKQLNIRPYWTAYKACDVINWDYQVNPVSRKTELSLLVLAENKTIIKDKFEREISKCRRVFTLDNDQVSWELWEWLKDEHGKEEWIQTIQPTLIDKFDQIPVAVIGKLGDSPVLTDLAYSNIEHAQTYSDYKQNIHRSNVTLPFTTGVDAGEFGGQVQAGGVMFHLPENATLAFAETKGTGIAPTRTCLEDLKLEMSWMGLRMLMPQPHGATGTATEAVIDQIQDTSELQVKATQLKDALELSLGHLAVYLGLDREKGGSIELGCSWDQMVLTSQEIQALDSAVTNGNYPLEYFLWKLHKAGQFPPDATVDEAMDLITEEVTAMRPIKDANLMNENTQNPNTQAPNAEVPNGIGDTKSTEVSPQGK